MSFMTGLYILSLFITVTGIVAPTTSTLPPIVSLGVTIVTFSLTLISPIILRPRFPSDPSLTFVYYVAYNMCVATMVWHTCKAGMWPPTSNQVINVVLDIIFTPAIFLFVEEIYYRCIAYGDPNVGRAYGYVHRWLRGVVLAVWVAVCGVFSAMATCKENEGTKAEGTPKEQPEASCLPLYSELDMNKSPLRYHMKAGWAV